MYIVSDILDRLSTITVGDNCVLKVNSRLISGSSMEDHSILLEHTLVLAGETVDSGSVWQGWPSQVHYPIGEHRAGLTNLLSTKDLELMSIFLSTNSASSLSALKRKKRRQRADRGVSSASSLVSQISAKGATLLRSMTQPYQRLSAEDSSHGTELL
jgi:hypothetical protein